MTTFRPDVLQLDACHRDVAEERCFVDLTSSLLGQVSNVWDIINISIYHDDTMTVLRLYTWMSVKTTLTTTWSHPMMFITWREILPTKESMSLKGVELNEVDELP